VKSNRDAWVFNSSKLRLRENVERMTRFFNAEATRLAQARQQGLEAYALAVERRSAPWRELASSKAFPLSAATRRLHAPHSSHDARKSSDGVRQLEG
jgi:hypothetical protein